MIIATSATIGEHALVSVPYLANQRFTNLTVKENYAKNIDIKYLYYYSFLLADWCKKNTTMSSFASVDMNGFRRFQIPIPCPDDPKKSLEIQAKIVRILDKFTALTTELTTELTARKKQYSYYREKLLTFEEQQQIPFIKKLLDGSEIEWLPLGDIGKFIRGNGLQKKDFTETGVGCIHYGQVYTHYGTYAHKTKSFVSEDFAKKSRKAQSGDLVIATTSENDEDVCKAVAWLGNEDICVSSGACIYRHNLEAKYVAYFFQTEQFQKQKRKYITGAQVRCVNADNLAKILIPIPPLTIQKEIVSILDKFDTLTHSISEGLPREIALRQKQYEYYREKLLNFPQFPSSGGVAGEA